MVLCHFLGRLPEIVAVLNGLLAAILAARAVALVLSGLTLNIPAIIAVIAAFEAVRRLIQSTLDLIDAEPLRDIITQICEVAVNGDNESNEERLKDGGAKSLEG